MPNGTVWTGAADAVLRGVLVVESAATGGLAAAPAEWRGELPQPAASRTAASKTATASLAEISLDRRATDTTAAY